MKEYPFYIGIPEDDGEGGYRFPKGTPKVYTVLMDEERFETREGAIFKQVHIMDKSKIKCF